MFLFDSNEVIKQTKTKRGKNSKSIEAVEAKAAAKAKKIMQDDMDALQITFYEIESWIEKTTPVLNRMTRELEKASKHFSVNKKPRHTPPSPAKNDMSLLLERYQHYFTAMQWSLSFLPDNSVRLETNITSIEQLVEAVQKIQLIAEPMLSDNTMASNNNDTHTLNDDHDSMLTPSYQDMASETMSEDGSITSTVIIDPSIEYWSIAMFRRPPLLDEDLKDTELNLKGLTEDVTPSVLTYICQTYWDCLHPKFSEDWSTFWDRSGDPELNQICIDSGLAMVFAHIIRHHNGACANAHALSYYYYNRARNLLMEYFDSPSMATIEALLNLSFLLMLKKQDSHSRTYLELAYRMMHQLNIHSMSLLSKDRLVRKNSLKVYLVFYYTDVMLSLYSEQQSIVDDKADDIDFYEIISLNKALIEHGEVNYDDRTIAKETFFAHMLELIRLSKRIQTLAQDYQRQNLHHHHMGALPTRWMRRVQKLEIALATWFDRLPRMYRIDPKPTEVYLKTHTTKTHDHGMMDVKSLREQSALLLMLQYQTQWLTLHKTFLSSNISTSLLKTMDISDADRNTLPRSPTGTTPYSTYRSHAICSDAANRIVVLAEIITEKFNWCSCQQFLTCVYQASLVYCKRIMNKDDDYKTNKAMIQRIMRILAANKVNYEGLPDDLTDCLNDFLSENNKDDAYPACSATVNNDLLDQIFPTGSISHRVVIYNDKMFNSPHMHQQCLSQNITARSSPAPDHAFSPEALYSIKLQNPPVVPIAMDFEDETSQKNWRCKFSSFNIASSHVN
ncbi:hypothetical protein A0J61_07963 [Choanephora cucurbitarum]|uniref:Transcription factor domain-containing protein n=1 Tax=Choanephora cucurbitarum TaxID=101091 RepID=A0A1C7N4E0_9FUNG|nr:hypothetical protein A0J61_07963 [Choanephora cucurbitarum]